MSDLKKEINQISPKDFIEKFMKQLPEDFQWQKTPMQIYPLESVCTYLITPTPPLQPNFNFIIYLESGSFVQQIGLEDYLIKAPSILVILTGTITSIKSLDKDIKGYYLLVEEKTVNTIFNKKDALSLFTIEPVLSLTDLESNWVNSIEKLLHEELLKLTPNKQIAHGLFQALIFKILELSNSKAHLNRNQKIAIEFKKLVYMHHRENKSVSFYAKELTVSGNYLNRCVKAVFNKTSKDMITEIRIIQSQLLLWDKSKDISEICYELNFEDPSYFSRIFKKLIGYTPTEYRLSIMHDLS